MASALRVQAIALSVPDHETGLEHLKIIDSTFTNNGSTLGAGVIEIIFPQELQNIILENNNFTGNSSHFGSGIVHIENLNKVLTPYQLNGVFK